MKRQSEMKPIFVINELYKSYQLLSEETKRKYFPGAEQQYVAVMESFSKINQKDYLKTILDNTQLYVSLYTFIAKALQDR